MRISGKARICLIGFLFLAVLMLCATAASEDTEDNLLYNGDFEILDAEGLPEGWFIDAYLMDPGYSLYSVSEGMDGVDSHAVTVNNTAKNDARFAQIVEVEPETMYCLSGYVRANEVTGGHGANLSVEGVYAFSEKTFDTAGEWKYIEYYGETGPDQYAVTVFARVGGYSGESKGLASFDKLKLTKADTLPEGVFADLWYMPESVAYDEEDEEEWGNDFSETGKAGPAWPALLAIAFIYCFLIAATVYYLRDGTRASLKESENRDGFRWAPFLFLAFGIRIILSYFIEGYAVDVSCFLSWGYTMKQAGPAGFYLQTSFCDYPPLYIYVLGLNSWLTSLLHTDAGWTRVVYRFIPSLCDVAGCWMLLHLPKDRFAFTKSRYFKLIVAVLAFNPATILNSAAWGQMDSVLCLLLLCVAVYALEGKWIPAILFYAAAVLVKPQALMLGILGLTYMIIASVKDKEARRKILYGLLAGVALIAVCVLPFGIRQQQADWLITKYADTLTSYPYATVNTANLYYITGGNWKGIETAAQLGAPLFCACACLMHGMLWYLKNRERKAALIELMAAVAFAGWFAGCAALGASWAYTGTAAMAYAFVIVLSMAIRKQDIRMLPYLGALLFILLYVFGVKMHERYLFPAFLLLLLAWAVHRDRRVLYLLIIFSITVFINEGVVLDNSIRLGSAKGHLNEDNIWLADILSILNIAGAMLAVYLGYDLMRDHHPGNVKRLPQLLKARTVRQGRQLSDYHADSKLHWTIRDTLILCAITVAYAAVSLTTLGSSKAPQTAWSSSGETEQIVFDLQETHDDIRMLYFGQVSRYDFTVESSEDGILWTDETYAQMDQGQCWKWKYVTQSYMSDQGKRTYYNSSDYIHHFRGRYIRVTSQQVGLILNEIIFRDADGNTIPAVVLSRTGDNNESELWSPPENLLDEQDTLEKLPGLFGWEQEGEAQPSWWNSTYFDEIYHARTGFEFMNGTTPYETSHPPLGKVFISWCISVFGMTPFGWRFAGALAGILMLPGIYLLGKQLTKKTWPAAFACLLMALDCMHLTQTQIATIDSFPVLFIIFAFFFMLRFIQTDLSACTMRQALIPLAFSGINMGLAVASKWIGIYAGIGLAVLYFWHCIRHVRMEKMRQDGKGPDMYRRVFHISLWCLLFFVTIPLVIYLLSYIPYLAYNTRIRSLGDYLAAVWRSQESMLSYHSTPGLGMDHPFYSPWWQWPIIGKPMYYATEQYIASDAYLHHSIFSFGNPVVWWGALAALLVVLIQWIRGKHYIVEGLEERWHLTSLSFDNGHEFVFIGLLAQYLPWVLVPRGTYIYHYFASIPFLILATMLCLTPEDDGQRFLTAKKVVSIVWVALAAIFFIILLPYATGMATPSAWLDIGKKILRIWY